MRYLTLFLTDSLKIVIGGSKIQRVCYISSVVGINRAPVMLTAKVKFVNKQTISISKYNEVCQKDNEHLQKFQYNPELLHETLPFTQIAYHRNMIILFRQQKILE